MGRGRVVLVYCRVARLPRQANRAVAIKCGGLHGQTVVVVAADWRRIASGVAARRRHHRARQEDTGQMRRDGGALIGSIGGTCRPRCRPTRPPARRGCRACRGRSLRRPSAQRARASAPSGRGTTWPLPAPRASGEGYRELGVLAAVQVAPSENGWAREGLLVINTSRRPNSSCKFSVDLGEFR